MASVTGIELGPDSCVLVGVRAGSKGPEIAALEWVASSEWPAHDVALTEKLQSIRRTQRFPRTAHVVGWGLPDGAKADDPMVQAALRPLTDAGFRIASVLTPAEALARLGVGRRRMFEKATVWLALNTFGGAIAIVRSTDLLFSRVVEWSFRPHPQPGTRSELLQRYSLVAHVAPEVQRGIAMVRKAHGVAVDTVVTCGDLPDLRSLTMPLIEELDLEVETLDSLEDLRAGTRVSQERLAERAPAIRLAYAAATPPVVVSHALPKLSAAAAVLLASLFGVAGYWLVSRSHREAPNLPQQNQPAPTDTSARATNPPLQQRMSPAPPPPQSPRVERTEPPPALSVEPAVPPAGVPVEHPAAGVAVPVDQVARNRGDSTVVPRPQGTQGVRPPGAVPTRRAAKPLRPLKEPLPVIDSILVDANRRLAVVQGRVVSVGDPVGSRVITQIERDFVVFTEPSGLAVRVKLQR